MNGRPFTPEEDQYLIDHYADDDTKEIMKILDRTKSSIYARATKLKIVKSEEAKKKYGCYLTGNEGKEYRFSKGHIPPNKGKKLTPEQYEKAKHTMFKKGQECVTKLPVGSVRIRHNYKRGTKYKWIKIAEPNKWMMLHRYNWTQEHGKIPAGMNLVFKNGDVLNCDLDNLELIDQEELMRRNTIHNRYPQELKDAIYHLAQVKRKINNHE